MWNWGVNPRLCRNGEPMNYAEFRVSPIFNYGKSRAGNAFLRAQTFSLGKDFYFMRQYFAKHKCHLIIFVILLLIAGMSWKFDFTKQNTAEITNSKLQIPNKISNPKSQTPKEYPISNIQYPDKTQNASNETQTQSQLQITNYKLQITTTSTVYDAMKQSKLDFKTKTFAGLGEFVEEIGGLKNDPQDGKYWIYFINGETAKLGISTQIVEPNDLIEWKYGTTDF